MLIDDVIIKVSAGNGGSGAVAFDKNKFGVGPTGANGGNGGNVYFIGVPELDALKQFRFRKELKAEDGKNGRGQFMDGRTGEDAVIKIPVGTVVYNLDNSSEKMENSWCGRKSFNCQRRKRGQR
jgi:GTP-binding protein